MRLEDAIGATRRKIPLAQRREAERVFENMKWAMRMVIDSATPEALDPVLFGDDMGNSMRNLQALRKKELGHED